LAAIAAGTQAAAPGALSPATRYARYNAAFAELDPPFAFVDLDAMWINSDGMLRRARGKPIRVASKSLRCRGLLSAVLERDPGYRGLLTFTLPETLWLASVGFSDLLVAYPTVDRAAIRALAELTASRPDDAPIVMVDCVEHLDLIEACAGRSGARIRVCLDFDASYWIAGGRVRVGPKRTPVHTIDQARALALEIVRRPGLALVAMMSYEGHIAGLGDQIPGNPLKSAVVGRLQRASYAELRARRAEAIAAVRSVASELSIVNAGGTGDLHLIADEDAITEGTAGSGFYAPTLFDTYSSFALEPAAMFALPVTRRPSPDVVTLLGGGYLASGVGGKDRMPRPYLPMGLKLDPHEGAGEVQTPVQGKAARMLNVNDFVYMRHAKAGELCERFDRLYLVSGERIVDELPTYRGEGKTFL
jgi:D-serine deaminase-like pyridoxal phosphate-dependent protein